jgi:phage terminase large subunit-like protein
LRDAFISLSQTDRLALAHFLAERPAHWIEALQFDFNILAHAHQQPPRLAKGGGDWTTWLILGGRGAGKTRAGAEWVRSLALANSKARIALIGETEHEAREVMVEGVSGLLAVHKRSERPRWTSSRRRVRWKNGAIAEIFSAEDPESLRGPQFSGAWCDELAKWRQVLGLGRTDPLSGDVAQWAMIVLTAYFGGRSLEKVARILGKK